jgi:2-polyprenyl-3-methyl-5-hydroxy-6-metoxy-1,4-benzoquinol methylase
MRRGEPAQARCPVCGTAAVDVAYDLRAARGPDAVPGVVFRCRGCPMWFKALDEGDRLPTAYVGEHGDDPVAATYLESEAARAVFRDALIPLAPTGGAARRLLDVGAAQGVLLEEAARLGFEAEGIDHCAENVRDAAARGRRVRRAAAETLDDRDAYDVVTLMDFIEHVTDPLAVLRACHRALRPGGTVVVYTPNHRAVIVGLAKLLHRAGMPHPVSEFFGRNHVSFFDDRSLPLALERAGFRVRTLRLSSYDPARPGQEVSRASLAAVAVTEWLGRPFGRVFRMLAYAEKPGSPDRS